MRVGPCLVMVPRKHPFSATWKLFSSVWGVSSLSLGFEMHPWRMRGLLRVSLPLTPAAPGMHTLLVSQAPSCISRCLAQRPSFPFWVSTTFAGIETLGEQSCICKSMFYLEMPRQMDFARNTYCISEERLKYSYQREVIKVPIMPNELYIYIF